MVVRLGMSEVKGLHGIGLCCFGENICFMGFFGNMFFFYMLGS